MIVLKSDDSMTGDNILSWLQINSLITALDASMESFEYGISFGLKERMENATGQDPTDVILGQEITQPLSLKFVVQAMYQ